MRPTRTGEPPSMPGRSNDPNTRGCRARDRKCWRRTDATDRARVGGRPTPGSTRDGPYPAYHCATAALGPPRAATCASQRARRRAQSWRAERPRGGGVAPLVFLAPDCALRVGSSFAPLHGRVNFTARRQQSLLPLTGNCAISRLHRGSGRRLTTAMCAGFAEVLRAVHVRHVRIHDLRHTCVSLLLA